MTHITVLGGTGYAGAHIAAEAVSRGHQVVSISRSAPQEQIEGVSYVTGDATDQGFLADVVSKTEAVVFALAPRGDMAGRVRESAKKVIPLTAEHDVRLLVVGGASSLKVSADGPRLFETPDFPEEFKPEAQEMTEIWEQDLKPAPQSLDWVYISPGALFGAHNPGHRRGSYRTDTSGVLLTDSEGSSDISGEDFAVALIDEIDKPQHSRTRFAVAY